MRISRCIAESNHERQCTHKRGYLTETAGNEYFHTWENSGALPIVEEFSILTSQTEMKDGSFQHGRGLLRHLKSKQLIWHPSNIHNALRRSCYNT